MLKLLLTALILISFSGCSSTPAPIPCEPVVAIQKVTVPTTCEHKAVVCGKLEKPLDNMVKQSLKCIKKYKKEFERCNNK